MPGCLSVSKLCKTYRQGAVTALDHVSFSVPEGSVCGLLGINGAGKTTLIKCAAGLITPESGSVTVSGRDILQDGAYRARSVSVVLDGGRNLLPYMTVRENMHYFTLLRGAGRRADQIFFASVAKDLGLSDLLDRRVQTLSFGMRQRASIAVSLACRSRVIFLDEPTTGLDIGYQQELSALLKRSQVQHQATIVVSSHDMKFIENTCTHCVLIHQGRLRKEGSIADFYEAFASQGYAVTLKAPLPEAALAALTEKLPGAVYEQETLTLSVPWPRERDFYELTDILKDAACPVFGIRSTDDLASAVLLLSKEGMT